MAAPKLPVKENVIRIQVKGGCAEVLDIPPGCMVLIDDLDSKALTYHEPTHKSVDITKDIVVDLKLTGSGDGRVWMRYQGHIIGCLRSTGWNLKKGFNIIHYPVDPNYPPDDSWFKVYREG